jgi:hypothetical protein
MDSQVLNWACIAAVLLMPGIFNFMVVTRTHGWLRMVVLLAVFILPLIAIYRGHQCHASDSGDVIDPCFADSLLAWAGVMLGVSALLGAAMGMIGNLHRHHHAPTLGSFS